MSRYEFSKQVKLAAWERCKGICECGCGNRIELGNGPDFHHAYLPATQPGSHTLDNCEVLRRKPCHAVITAETTIPMQAKSRRTIEKRINAREKRGGFRGWRKFDGTPVWK